MNSDGRACCPPSKGHTRKSQRKKDFGRGSPETTSYASRLPRAYLQRRSLRDMEHNALIRRSPFPTVRSATKGKSRSATIGEDFLHELHQAPTAGVVLGAAFEPIVRNWLGLPFNHYFKGTPSDTSSLLLPCLQVLKLREGYRGAAGGSLCRPSRSPSFSRSLFRPS